MYYIYYLFGVFLSLFSFESSIMACKFILFYFSIILFINLLFDKFEKTKTIIFFIYILL